jgi:hypothetical protein
LLVVGKSTSRRLDTLDQERETRSQAFAADNQQPATNNPLQALAANNQQQTTNN